MHRKNQAFDHALRPVNDEAGSLFPGGFFLLAKVQPKAFIRQLSWEVSANLDELFFDQMAESPAACFNSRIWLSSWIGSIANDGKNSVQIVTGSFAGTTVIALPLSVVTGKFTTKLQFAAQNVSDYNAPVVHRELAPYLSSDLLNNLFEQVAELFPDADCLDFRKCLREDIRPIDKTLYWQEDPENSHLCTLSGDWERDLSGFIGKSSRKSLKRKLKKLESMGEVTFAEAKSPQQKEAMSQQLIEWKADQLSDLGAANIFKDQKFCAFLESTIVDDNSGMVRLFALQIDNKPVAIVHMLCRENRWFLYQTAYTSAEAGKYSPGYLLLLNIMEQACRGGVGIFDFGWGNEAYKLRFASQSLTLYHAFLPLTLKGRIAMFASNAKILIKNFAKSNKHAGVVAKIALRAFSKFKNG